MEKEPLIIDGKYKLLTEIGEGGMSRVYLAHDIRLNKQWAVKELKSTGNRVNDEIIAKSFIKEANMMKQLDHPFLPRIVDIVNQGDSVFVVMDYIEGRSLAKILEEYGPQPQSSVIEWGLDLCIALDYLHRRNPPIVYRDMKPANVMLRPDGTVRIVDFGIAREYKETAPGTRIDDTTILGTRGYAAPEQFGGIGQSDPRTDIYCLGATLYHLLTGLSPAEPPYEMYPIRQINPSLSPGLEKIITKCVQQNPAARYQSCAELYYALENYEKADDAYFVRQRKKLRTFIVSAVLAVVLALGGSAALVGNTIVLRNSYEGLLDRAAKAQNDERMYYYLEAIELMPGNPRAYLELIAFYKEDGWLDIEEYYQLTVVLEKNQNKLRASGEYPAFAFEVGKLYWYFDDGNLLDGQRTRSSRAKPWFLEATATSDESLRKSAQIYYQLASFDTDLFRLITEGEEAGIYRLYFDNLVELNLLLATEPNSIVKLRAAAITMGSIEMYASRFKADGVSKAELLKLINGTEVLLRGITLSKETLLALAAQKRAIEDRLPSIRQAVDDAYWEKAGS